MIFEYKYNQKNIDVIAYEIDQLAKRTQMEAYKLIDNDIRQEQIDNYATIVEKMGYKVRKTQIIYIE